MLSHHVLHNVHCTSPLTAAPQYLSTSPEQIVQLCGMARPVHLSRPPGRCWEMEELTKDLAEPLPCLRGSPEILVPMDTRLPPVILLVLLLG